MHSIKMQHRKQRNWFGWHFDCNILRLLLSWQMRIHVVFSYDFFWFFCTKKFQGSTNIVDDNCIVGLFSHCIVHLRIASLFGAVKIHSSAGETFESTLFEEKINHTCQQHNSWYLKYECVFALIGASALLFISGLSESLKWEISGKRSPEIGIVSRSWLVWTFPTA